jgi:hypothetical protein
VDSARLPDESTSKTPRDDVSARLPDESTSKVRLSVKTPRKSQATRDDDDEVRLMDMARSSVSPCLS